MILQSTNVRMKIKLFSALLAISCCVQAGIIAHRPGDFHAVFDERSPLSDVKDMARRMRHDLDRNEEETSYDITQESFEVFVPSSYATNAPHGLLVWCNAADGGTIPGSYRSLMHKYKLIWIGPNKIGNSHNHKTRRMPLVLDAAHNIQKFYNIDDQRVYIMGFSGGARNP